MKVLTSPATIAAEAISHRAATAGPLDEIPAADLSAVMQQVAETAIMADRLQVREALTKSDAIAGIRSFPLISANDLIEAYVAYDGEVDTFVHTWQGYIQDEDFPCPDSLDGLHYVTSGSCDMCGDKNRD